MTGFVCLELLRKNVSIPAETSLRFMTYGSLEDAFVAPIQLCRLLDLLLGSVGIYDAELSRNLIPVPLLIIAFNALILVEF